MKNLSDIFKEHPKQLYKHNELREILGEHTPKEFEWGRDYVLETLNSHDTKLIMKKLFDMFPDANFNVGYGKNKFAFAMSYDDPESLRTNLEFQKILDFYGYYITSIEGNCLTIEPKYSENITKKLIENHGICYHFTDNASAESILKNGLRCKKSKYREFPERIYLIIDKNIGKNGVLNDEYSNFVLKVVDTKRLKKYGLAVLKINLKHNNIDVYRDSIMSNPGACFTYNSIPAQYIKKLDMDLPESIRFALNTLNI